MLYEEIVTLAMQNIRKNATKDTKQDFAAEINICGEGEGAFYISVKNGKVTVAPYEYYDRDVKIKTDADELTAILNGEKTAAKSFAENKILVEGNIDILEDFDKLIKKTTRSSQTKNKVVPSVQAEKTIVKNTKSKKSKIAEDIKK